MKLTEGTLFDCRTEDSRIILEKIWQRPEADSGKVVLSEPPKRFQMNCFGRFLLLREGRPVELSHRKVKEALAYLACAEGQPVGKRAAAAALWPGRPEGQAMDSLYKVCRELRALAARGDVPEVRMGRDSMWLDLSQVDCDLLTFQAWSSQTGSIDSLRQAVELYRGPLLLEEGYEWTERLEGFYDIRYLALLELLADYFGKVGQEKAARYYKGLMDAL